METIIFLVAIATLLFIISYNVYKHYKDKREYNDGVRYICPETLSQIGEEHISDLYPNDKYNLWYTNGLFGIIDKQGNVIIKPIYDEIRSTYNSSKIEIKTSWIEKIKSGKNFKSIEKRVYYLKARIGENIEIIHLPIMPKA